MSTRIRTGLRWRIGASIAVIVLIAVGGLGVAVHLLVVQNRVREARASADERIAAAVEIDRATGILAFDAQRDAPDLPPVLRSAVARDGSRATLVTGGATRDLWAAARDRGHVLSIHSNFPAVDDSVRSVDRALLVAGAVTVLAASALGVVSAAGLSARLRLAARAARGVGTDPDRPSLRAAVGSGRDEVGELADAVDAMAAQLAERVRAEQRFTADVAHDLRTPVTGLVTAAALLDDSRPAELVRDRAAALTVLVEELLEVARLDLGSEVAELDDVDLNALVRRAVDRGVSSGEFPADQVIVTGSGGPTAAYTDPLRLQRILSNLIRNAVTHGRPPVEISADANVITVRDHGPGFPPELLDQGPQRFRQGTGHRGSGHGLGLVIAIGQAAVVGAELEFATTSPGALVTIRLPPAVVDPGPS